MIRIVRKGRIAGNVRIAWKSRIARNGRIPRKSRIAIGRSGLLGGQDSFGHAGGSLNSSSPFVTLLPGVLFWNRALNQSCIPITNLNTFPKQFLEDTLAYDDYRQVIKQQSQKNTGIQ